MNRNNLAEPFEPHVREPVKGGAGGDFIHDPVFDFDRMRQMREDAGMSRRELGERLGVSTQSVATWETGQVCPSFSSVARVCEILEVEMGALVAWKKT